MNIVRTGKKVTGEQFSGFDDLKIGDLVMFNDDVEKQTFGGMIIVWKV